MIECCLKKARAESSMDSVVVAAVQNSKGLLQVLVGLVLDTEPVSGYYWKTLNERDSLASNYTGCLTKMMVAFELDYVRC